MSQYLNECLAGCEGLSTDHAWLRKSPYQLCVNACKKGSKHDTGYGDPDQIFDVGVNLDAELDASFANMPGAADNEMYVESDYRNPALLVGAGVLVLGLVMLGVR